MDLRKLKKKLNTQQLIKKKVHDIKKKKNDTKTQIKLSYLC